MAVVKGSNKIDDGLILHFDAANNKSFRGEPTTNIFTVLGNSGFGSSSDNGVSFAVNGTGTFIRMGYGQTFGGYTIKSSDVVYKYDLGSNGCHYHGNDVSIPAGNYATFSFDYYISPNTINLGVDNNLLASFEQALGGAITLPNNNTGIWQSVSLTSGPTGGGNLRSLLYPGGCGPRLASSGYILYRNPQVEFLSYKTPFVNGTRGTTVATGGGLKDLSLNGKHAEFNNGPIYSSSNNGSITMDGVNDVLLVNQNITNSTQCTVVMWLASTDTQFLWGIGNTGAYYFGASVGGGNYYHENCGSPTYYIDTNQVLSPVGYLDNNFHMFEAKGVNLSTWTKLGFLDYGTGSWNMNGKVAIIQVYDRILTAEESKQNYNSNKCRFI
jgi:hypothetical protein